MTCVIPTIPVDTLRDRMGSRAMAERIPLWAHVEIIDDGRGFDIGSVAARGRRNFGLQFMQERAELIGARFEVLSRPDGGTIVRLAVPVGREESGS